MEPLLELTESLHRAGLPGGGALPHLGSELLRVFPSHLQNKTKSALRSERIHLWNCPILGGRGKGEIKGPLSSWVFEAINFLPRSQ